MNAIMNINVRVASAKAQAEVRALRAEVARLQAQAAGAGAAAAGGRGSGGGLAMLGSAAALSRMQKWGSQLQWTGRQLQTNFTLPLLIAGGAAAKWELDNEKAFTHVKKVYGDVSAAAAQFRKESGNRMSQSAAETKAQRIFNAELRSLDEAFTAISSHYGVQKKQVLEVAGAWAAAGQSGRALADSVNMTMQAMILGDMDAAKATQALIGIQAQYNLSTKQLGYTMAELNAIENQTAASFPDLVEGFTRAAGVAREAGVDTRHLGAMLAALVPASGGAAQAGNALKTIFSRLFAPTKESAEVMGLMGINTKDMAWQGANATERLMIMSKKFKELSDSQKTVVSAVIASRYQINKFNILMDELAKKNGYYQKALEATSNRQKIYTQMQKELNAVLESNPRRLSILWTTLQNASADIIQPLIPYILALVAAVTGLIKKFQGLDPSLQKFVLLAGLTLALIGPIIRYMSSLVVLVAVLGKGFVFLFGGLAGMLRGFVGLFVGSQIARGGLIGMAATILSMPFRVFMAGIGAMIGQLSIFFVWLRTTPAIVAAFGAGMAAISGFVGTAMVGAISIATKYLTILRSFMFAGGTIAGYSLSAGLVAARGTIALVFGAFGVAARVGIVRLGVIVAEGLAAVVLFVVRWTASMNYISYGFWVAWNAIAAAALNAHAAIVASWRYGVIGLYTLLYTSIVGVASAGYARLVALQVTFSNKTFALYTTMQTRVLTIFTAMHTKLAGIAAVAWTRIQSIIALGMAGVRTILIAGGKALFTLWTTTQAAIVATTTKAWKAIPGLIAAGSKAALAAMTGPWGILAAAIVIIVVALRDQLAKIWNNLTHYFADSSNKMTQAVIKAWYALPKGVRNALMAVVNMVKSAAMAIYNLFSYINPFAHHSPSLVENVTNGMAEVQKQFASLDSVEGHIKGAYAAIKAFGKATASLRGRADSFDQAEQIAKIKKFMPGAVAEYYRMAGVLKTLNQDLAQINAQVEKQQAVVDAWKNKLDAANAALDAQSDKLDKLKDIASAYQDKLDASKDALSNYASAPLVGMREVEDQIFANEMAQKKLQLQMLKMGDTGDIDKLKDKLAMLQGAQENLLGERNDLRGAGAGSEILSVYDDQLKAMEEQRKAVADQMKPIQDMSDALAELQRQAQIMDLEKSLKFDPLTRSIDQAANAVREMPFDEIMAGIKKSKDEIALYTTQVDAANDAVKRQEEVVKSATVARDAISARYDQEQKQLDALKDRYDKVNDAIQAIKQSMDDAASAADRLQQAQDDAQRARDAAKQAKKAGAGPKAHELSPGGQNFMDAAGGNFENQFGAGIPKRADFSSQAADIDKFTKDLQKQTGDMFGSLNPFDSIKKKWGEFKKWLGGIVPDLKAGFGDMVNNALSGINIDTGDISKKWNSFWDGFKKTISTVWDWIKKIFQLFWPDIKRIFEALKGAAEEAGKQLGPFFKDLIPLVKPVAKIFGQVALAIGSVLLPVIKILVSMFTSALGPALKGIIAIIGNVLQVIKGIVEVIVGVIQIIWGALTGDNQMVLDGVKNLLHGLYDIFAGTFGAIWGLIKGVFGTIWGLAKGFVTGIVEFFKWLYDVLVGHSIIPDLVHAIVDFFNWMIAPIKAVWNAITASVQWLGDTLGSIWNGIKDVIGGVWDWISQKISDVWNWIKTNVVAIIQADLEVLKAIWNGLKTAVGAVWDWISKKISDVWNWLKSNVVAIIKADIEVLKAVWNGLKTAIGAVWDWIKEKISNVWNWIKQNIFVVITAAIAVFKSTWQSLKDKLGDVWDGIKNVVQGAWNNLKGNFDRLKDIAGSIGDKFRDLKNRIGDIFGGIKSAIGGAVDWIRDKINGALGLIGKIKDKIGGVFGGVGGFIGGLFAAGGVIPYADGGAVATRRKNGGPFSTKSPIALVGEGSKTYKEYVIPTDPQYHTRAVKIWQQTGMDLGVLPKNVIPLAAGGITAMNARSNQSARLQGATAGTVNYNVTTTQTINITGNLEFPNISNGDDAEEFIENLRGLAG